MSDEKIINLASAYFTLEEIILDMISKLPEYGKDCNCRDSDRFSIVDDGIIVRYCLNCGGTITWQ